MNITFDITGRQYGKTSRMVQWVLEGERTPTYPYWSRIMLVHSIQEAQRVRQTFPKLDYRQVFSYEEWEKAIKFERQPMIALDNVDIYLRWRIGPVVLVSGTGEV